MKIAAGGGIKKSEILGGPAEGRSRGRAVQGKGGPGEGRAVQGKGGPREGRSGGGLSGGGLSSGGLSSGGGVQRKGPSAMGCRVRGFGFSSGFSGRKQTQNKNKMKSEMSKKK